jgi:hypothetical protein
MVSSMLNMNQVIQVPFSECSPESLPRHTACASFLLSQPQPSNLDDNENSGTGLKPQPTARFMLKDMELAETMLLSGGNQANLITQA